ncbi:MAG: hypothetical protein KC621_03510, partial [Myxococcales bacterium]|nr:hypothetical protein [Myxococcales bacterium]
MTLLDAGPALAAGRAWSGLGGDALAFVLATDVARSGRWLLVCDEQDRADRLLRGLRFFAPEPERCQPFPADDGRPYDGFSPDAARVHQRLKTLERLDRGGDLVVVTTARALLQRVPDAATRKAGTLAIEVGQRIDRDDLVSFLTDAGYLHTIRADDPGRFVARGDLVDVWPTGGRTPIRIELFDDEVERLVRLNPDTGRPDKTGKRFTVLPAAEERVDGPARDRALAELGRIIAASGDASLQVRRRTFVEDLRAGVRFSALQDWLPALVGTVAPLDAFAGLRHLVVGPGDVEAALRDAEGDTRRRYEALEPDERPLVPPSERYIAAAEVLAVLSGAHEVHELGSDRAVDLGATGTEELTVRGADLGPVVSRLQQLAGSDVRVGLVVEDEARRDRLEEMLAPHGLHPERADRPDALDAGEVSVLVGDLPRGFLAPQSGWAFVPVTALFGAPRRQATADRAHELWESSVTAATQLKVDDPVVHRLHGVGLYKGLVRLAVRDGVEQDFVRLEYRDGDLLFLPVAALEQISRYTASSAGARPALDKLGGLTFAKKKGKVRDHLLSMAHELLRLYARRELAGREPLGSPGPRYRAFEARFPYRETPDQAHAIDAVMDDLTRGHPMDRLVCGDVGFG